MSVLPRVAGQSASGQGAGAMVAVPVGGKPSGMRFGNLEVRPLGGGLGCLFMVLFSVVASVALTVLVNLLLRQHLGLDRVLCGRSVRGVRPFTRQQRIVHGVLVRRHLAAHVGWAVQPVRSCGLE
jgi:hypothetical protein